MERPTIQKTFLLGSEHPKVLGLTTDYSESIRYKRQTGGNLFVDFQVRLSSKSAGQRKDEIKLTVTAVTADELMAVEKGISSGITRFVADQEKLEVSIEGFDILVENQLFHLVDSRPWGYDFMMYRILERQLKTLEDV